MKAVIALLLVFSLVCIGTAFAETDSGPATKTETTKPESKKAPASQPTKDEDVKPLWHDESKKVPSTTTEAIDSGKEMIGFAKEKKWFAFSAGAIWLLMFLFKLGRKKLDFMKGIPKRALWIAVPILSVAAMLLSKFQADLSWGAAFTVLSSGPSVAFLNDLLKRGLLGKEPSPMAGEKEESS
jgi:hypothetical protein